MLLIAHGRPHSDAWVGWATQVSVRRLEEDVDRALLLNETDPEEFARTAGVPVEARGETAEGEQCAPGGERSRDRQIGAHVRDAAETSRLFVHVPRAVTRLVRAVLCTVRRTLERQTGRLPTDGEAFQAMLEHALDAWLPPNARVRAAHRVFARDGWRCTVPGCSAFRNLHDHHIVFWSAGGSAPRSAPGTICAACTPASCAARASRPTGCASSWGSGAMGRRW